MNTLEELLIGLLKVIYPTSLVYVSTVPGLSSERRICINTADFDVSYRIDNLDDLNDVFLLFKMTVEGTNGAGELIDEAVTRQNRLSTRLNRTFSSSLFYYITILMCTISLVILAVGWASGIFASASWPIAIQLLIGIFASFLGSWKANKEK